MNKSQLEELKKIVAILELNSESNNIESGQCECCCMFTMSGSPPTKEELQKVESEISP